MRIRSLRICNTSIYQLKITLFNTCTCTSVILCISFFKICFISQMHLGFYVRYLINMSFSNVWNHLKIIIQLSLSWNDLTNFLFGFWFRPLPEHPLLIAVISFLQFSVYLSSKFISLVKFTLDFMSGIWSLSFLHIWTHLNFIMKLTFLCCNATNFPFVFWSFISNSYFLVDFESF